MKISSFLNLRKPEGKDNYNVDDMNYNFEKVEQTISTMQTRQSDSVKNLQAQIDKKQSQLSFDSEPKANSSNFETVGVFSNIFRTSSVINKINSPLTQLQLRTQVKC